MSTDDAGAAPRSGPLLLPFKCPLSTAAAVPVAGGGRRLAASGRAQPPTQPQQHCPEGSKTQGERETEPKTFLAHALKCLRPLAVLRARVFRPPGDFNRTRKPCLFFRLRQ